MWLSVSQCGRMFVRGWLLAALLITIVTAAPDIPASWTRPQPQQTLHGLMISIDEKLHTLEISRWETTLKQVEQRLDALDATVRRLDTSFQDRLDKLDRNMNSKELKDELTVEKLSHKVRDILDSSYDRYNRRLGYTEERLEMSFKKVQMNIEGSLNRIEKQQEDIQTEVMEGITILEDLKSHSLTTEDKLNSTHKAMQHHIQSVISPNTEELQRISGTLEHLGTRFNNSLGMWGSQNDGPQVNDVITTIRKEINTEGTKFTNKVNNMYNDLWRRMIAVETIVKDLNRLGNMTQREVLEEIRSFVLTDHRDFPGDSQENFVEVALDALERKLQRKLLELGRKLDDRLDTLSATQNMVMDSCFDGGICRGLESRVSQVLEKIVDVFSDKIEGFSNRTFDMDSLVLEMMELVKTQHSQLIRTVSHNTNMVVTLAKDSSDTNKLIQNSITQFVEKTESNFQEVHDEFQEVLNTSGKVCIDSDKNITEHPDQPKPIDIPKNITEVQMFTSNITTQVIKNHTTKNYDTGILKITTDDIDILADNSTSGELTQTINTPPVVDSSIMKIVAMISPNLTLDQVDSLLHFLNSSVSLENLEAIIQNTEADAEDDMVHEGGSVELYEVDTSNKTNPEVYLSNPENKDIKVQSISGYSDERENISNETNVDLDESEMLGLRTNTNTTNIDHSRIKITANPKSLEIPTEIRDPLKFYAILMKIKYDNLNVSQVLEKTNNSLHQDEEQQKLTSLVQQICYENKTIEDMSNAKNVMRNRLILIKDALHNAHLYNKIELICNKITESLQSTNIESHVFTTNE